VRRVLVDLAWLLTAIAGLIVGILLIPVIGLLDLAELARARFDVRRVPR
jgi:hypothetical protein